jgi:hypothetical protein
MKNRLDSSSSKEWGSNPTLYRSKKTGWGINSSNKNWPNPAPIQRTYDRCWGKNNSENSNSIAVKGWDKSQYISDEIIKGKEEPWAAVLPCDASINDSTSNVTQVQSEATIDDSTFNVIEVQSDATIDDSTLNVIQVQPDATIEDSTSNVIQVQPDATIEETTLNAILVQDMEVMEGKEIDKHSTSDGNAGEVFQVSRTRTHAKFDAIVVQEKMIQSIKDST